MLVVSPRLTFLAPPPLPGNPTIARLKLIAAVEQTTPGVLLDRLVRAEMKRLVATPLNRDPP